MGTPTVEQQKLVLGTFASRLENNLVAGDAFDWKGFDKYFDGKNALSVSEDIPPRFDATETIGGVKDLSSGGDDAVFGSETYQVDRTFNVNMDVGDFEAIRDMTSARDSQALTSQALNLAEKIDQHCMSIAATASSNWVGTPGQIIDDHNEFVSGLTRLKKEGVLPVNLSGIMDYDDQQALQDYIVNLNAPGDEAKRALREGFSGKISGVKTAFTQGLQTLTTGTRTTSGAALVNGASQNVDYSDVALSTAQGRYCTQTLAIDGLTGSATIKQGEVFNIADVYAYDPRSGKALPHLQDFVVVADATMSTGAGTITIFPAIVVPGTGSGSEAAVNNANATVSAAPANDAAITFKGSASTVYTPRFIAQKQAIKICTAKLRMPDTGVAMTRKLKNLPLEVRMWKNSNWGDGKHGVRFDVALTANIADRRRLVRVNGIA